MKYLFYTLLLIVAMDGQAHTIITNPPQSDGFGSQLQTIIAAAIYAELMDNRFLYRPFQTMHHNYDKDPDFIAKKEQFINFIGNFEITDSVEMCDQDALNMQFALKRFFDTHVVLCAQSNSLKKIKQVFRANKNLNNYFNNENLNVAIHVRRHNQEDDRIEGTDTPDSLFLHIIDALRVLYSAQNPLFHIYSQGSDENFKAFDAQDIVLHLNQSVEDAFLALVVADVLVTAASSFSYAAGILSDGVVYYIPFWHTPLPNWISVYSL